MYSTTDTAKALATLIKAADYVNNNGVPVIRGGFVNNDPNRAPWVGVYRGKTKINPATLGSGTPWQVEPTFRIVVQESHLQDYEKCEDKLNDLVDAIIDGVQDDLTLGGTVDMVTAIEVEYGFIDTEVETLHFQSAIITLTVEAEQ